MHPLEGRRHHGRLSGGLARTLYGDKCGVCCHPFGLGKGDQGIADLQCRAQAGLVCQGGLPSGLAKGGYEFPLPQFRATLQRATLPESRLLPVPDQDDQEPQPATEQLLHPLPGTYHPQGGTGQGYCPQVPRSDRAIRADYERKRFYSPLSPDGRGDYRDGGDAGTD